jgi:RNA polymerase sigma factor (sigma-70 family)
MDEQYIQKVLDGDVNAFRYFVSNYKDLAYSISMSIVKSELTAQEAVQDAFVKAFENLSKFKGKSKFSTWLYRIVVNESLRKIKQKRLETVDLTEETISNTVFSQMDSFKSIHEVEQKEIINETLKIMPQTESLLLRLYYLEENKVDEICEITGLNTPNVKVILHRARKRFYAILENSYKNEIRTIL